jgi:hypothetical protein
LARGQYDQVVAFSDATIVNAAEDTPALTHDYLAWVMDTRAHALFGLGRIDEAIAQQAAAAARASRAEQGDRVSHTINLGAMRLRQGRPVDAIAALAAVGDTDVSPYGLMQAYAVRACAAFETGDTETADSILSSMRENWRDAPAALHFVLACRGDLQGMGDLWLARLDDPELASKAISAFHDYMSQPHLTAFDRRLQDITTASQALPEVRQKFDSLARVLQLPVVTSQY